jgi:hypothetical protein
MNKWGISESREDGSVGFRLVNNRGREQEAQVAKHGDPSGSLALSRRPRTLSRAVAGSPPFSAASVLQRRAPQPAEIAQARVFERLLQTECAELQDLAHRLSGDKYQSDVEELTQIRSRIDEVHGLLQALQGRFPHSLPEGDR